MTTVKLWNAETGRARLVTLRPGMDVTTCGTCGRSWDDALVTSVTPAPGARCPFEYMTGHGERPRRPDIQRTIDRARGLDS